MQQTSQNWVYEDKTRSFHTLTKQNVCSFTNRPSLLCSHNVRMKNETKIVNNKHFNIMFLAATSGSTGRSVGLLVHKNSSHFGSHSFHARRLKFVMEVKCVCDKEVVKLLEVVVFGVN